MACDQQGLKY